MKKKPPVILIFSLCYVLTPVFFIIQYFYFSHTSLLDGSTWQTLLTPYKLSFIIIPPIIAYGIFKIHSWGWFLSLVHMFYILGNNTLAFLVGSRTPPWAILIFSIVTLGVLLTFVRKEIRAPYFNPRVRWWESKPRYAISLKVEMENQRTQISGETFNISEGGMFMVSDADVKINEEFGIQMIRNGSNPVQSHGKIVWVNPAGQSLPQGFGFQFTRIEKSAISEIRQYIKDQKKVLKGKALFR